MAMRALLCSITLANNCLEFKIVNMFNIGLHEIGTSS